MKKYEVSIAEIYEVSIEVEAENREQAEQIACSKWMRGDLPKDKDEYRKIDFFAKEKVKTKERER